MNKIILSISLLVGGLASAQIQVQSEPSSNISQQNPFLDASGYNSYQNNIGKGLYFPKTDLTTWEFKTTNVSARTFRTYFDGMIVYNSGTGNTISDATKGGKQVAVTPGFYYFKNSGQTAPSGSVANGQWVRLGADASAFDGEWVYDETTKRINLKRSGQTVGFVNNVFYDEKGGYKNYPADVVASGIAVKQYNATQKAFVDGVSPFLTNIKNLQVTNLKDLGILEGTRTESNTNAATKSKRVGSNTLIYNSADDTEELNSVGHTSYSSIIPPNNANNYKSLYGVSDFFTVQGSGTIGTLWNSYSDVNISQGQALTGSGGAKLNTITLSSNANNNGNLYATYSRIYAYGSEGTYSKVANIATESTSLYGEDKNLFKSYYGIENTLSPNSQNTGTGTELAGLKNRVVGATKVLYPNAYGIYNSIKLTGTKPTNLYGLYIDDVNSGAETNYAVYTKAGKVRVGDLADTSVADGVNRQVVVDKDGVLKVGTAAATSPKAIDTQDTCTEANVGSIHYKEVDIAGTNPVQKKGVFGFCTKQNGTTMWVYLSNGANLIQGTGTFGSGL